MLEKGKGPMIGKLRTTTLTQADLQFTMRTFLNEDKEDKIKKDDVFSKSNYGPRKNDSIETEILEKRLTFDSSLLSNKATTCNMTDLQSAYDRKLPNIGGTLE